MLTILLENIYHSAKVVYHSLLLNKFFPCQMRKFIVIWQLGDFFFGGGGVQSILGLLRELKLLLESAWELHSHFTHNDESECSQRRK